MAHDVSGATHGKRYVYEEKEAGRDNEMDSGSENWAEESISTRAGWLTSVAVADDAYLHTAAVDAPLLQLPMTPVCTKVHEPTAEMLSR